MGFNDYIRRIEDRETAVKTAKDSLHALKHEAIRSSCPYSFGQRVKITGVYTCHLGSMMLVDNIELERRLEGLIDNQWYWLLSGRLILKSGHAGIVKTKCYKEITDGEPDEQEPAASEGAGV